MAFVPPHPPDLQAITTYPPDHPPITPSPPPPVITNPAITDYPPGYPPATFHLIAFVFLIAIPPDSCTDESGAAERIVYQVIPSVASAAVSILLSMAKGQDDVADGIDPPHKGGM